MRKILSLLLSVFVGSSLHANNIQVSGVNLSGQNTGAHYSLVNFNVNWDHSWRTVTNESNYDGAWIFVKFRKNNTSLWQHATLNYVAPGTAAASGHTQPSGSTLQGSADGKGIWIYRNATGTGSVNFSGAQLRWNYGLDGVLDNDSVEVRVFAVEMVYCTPGQFYLGSGGTEISAFKTAVTNTPYSVTSEAAITVGTSSGNLTYASSTYSGDQTGPIPASFPKGYNAFWIMKYECSQQQYVDFLNTLDATKANNRNMGFSGGANNFIATNPERPIGSFSNTDHLAFLDWAAMRPMTELEYEKACRGYNNTPIANEYAWGNTTISYTVSVFNAGTATETQQQGNATYYPLTSYLGRPIRCGAFANDTTTTRTQTGGSYYGATELSGNLWELVVTTGNATGRAFTGLHGDGNLTAVGEANVTNWSDQAIGARGGAYDTQVIYLTASDRSNATYIAGVTRQGNFGCRGARTAE